ncbi:uncharacterized protein METZ01_LOCUS323900, partial [marine metagenome]
MESLTSVYPSASERRDQIALKITQTHIKAVSCKKVQFLAKRIESCFKQITFCFTNSKIILPGVSLPDQLEKWEMSFSFFLPIS